MMDTQAAMARTYRDLLLRRSGEDRLKMGSSMHATARALVRASVLAEDPFASPTAVRRALFLRFYGGEFGAEARQKILAALGGGAGREGGGATREATGQPGQPPRGRYSP